MCIDTNSPQTQPGALQTATVKKCFEAEEQRSRQVSTCDLRFCKRFSRRAHGWCCYREGDIHAGKEKQIPHPEGGRRHRQRARGERDRPGLVQRLGDGWVGEWVGGWLQEPGASPEDLLSANPGCDSRTARPASRDAAPPRTWRGTSQSSCYGEPLISTRKLRSQDLGAALSSGAASPRPGSIPPSAVPQRDLHPRPLMPPNASLRAFSSLEGAAGKVWDPLGLSARAEWMLLGSGMLVQPSSHAAGLQGG